MKDLLMRISYTSSAGRFIEILDILDEMNVEYEVQEFCNNYDYSAVRNIIVHLGDGGFSDIALSCHYDIIPGSCGANDNGSSCVILLKFIETYIASGCTKNIDIIFFDKEETGFIGSKKYVENVLDTDEKKNMFTLINLDVCGCGDDIVVVDELRDNNKYEDLLFSDDAIDSYGLCFASSFPPSDVVNFSKNKIDNVSISVFPAEDAYYLTSVPIDDKDFYAIKNHDDNAYQARYNHKRKIHERFGFYFLEIFKYMHNAEFDDITYINFDIMEKIKKYLSETIIGG